MKLSHSAANKYLECPLSYRLHYVDKLRPIAEPSSLTFGSCVDRAFSAMLIPGPETPENIFLAEWKKAYVDNPNATFSKSDLDTDLIPIGWTNPNKADIIPEMSAESLKQKGLLMLKALREKVVPNIEKVLGIQVPISLKNQDGSEDEIIGFIDFVATYKGYDKPIIWDLKTSSVPYKNDAVKESPQLSLYSYAKGEEYNTDLAGFVVLGKKIRKIRTKVCQSCNHTVIGSRAKSCDNEVSFGVATSKGESNFQKRCNGEWAETVEFDVDVQIIVDSITPKESDKVVESFDSIHEKIKCGSFEANTNSCIHPVYKKRCVFYSLCHENSMEGLVKKE